MNQSILNIKIFRIVALASLITMSSCVRVAVPMAITVVKLVGKAGKVIKESAIGVITERAIDGLIDWIAGEDKEESTTTENGIAVLPYPNNNLKGYAQNNYKIIVRGNRQGRESSTEVPIKNTELVFERLNLSSPWELTMDSERLVNQYTKNGCAQLSLRDLGYDPKGIDGKVGNRTRRAIRAFQKDYNLSVTGKLDDPTIIALLGDEFITKN